MHLELVFILYKLSGLKSGSSYSSLSSMIRNVKVFWNEKESNGPQSGVGLEQLCLNKTASPMNIRSSVKYLVHAV